MKKKHPITRTVLTGTVLTLLLAAVPAAAHQCINVEILRAPNRAEAGEVIHVENAVINCGEPARGFLLTWALVSEAQGVREVLRRVHVELRPDEREHGHVRLWIPDDIEPGRYALVFTGKTPSGFKDRDLHRLSIVRDGEGEDGGGDS